MAASVLVRIDRGAFANAALASALAGAGLDRRDASLVTELVYGTLRMRRACDWLVERWLSRRPPPEALAALRLGAYQLAFLGTPAHAAVSSAVAATPRRWSGMVNAVLRRVAEQVAAGTGGRGEGRGEGGGEGRGEGIAWPDLATWLSYPDWIVALLEQDLGEQRARGALEAMNHPPRTPARADGYVQDLASQWVVEMLPPPPGGVVWDACAAPGGKWSALSALAALPALPALRGVGSQRGAPVVASDLRAARVRAMVRRLGGGPVVVADARNPPFRPASVGMVLVDAPCSGLGALRRRPDARWRLEPGDVDSLMALQRQLVAAAAAVLAPGGVLAYSVCTLTGAETLGLDRWAAEQLPEMEPLTTEAVGPWEPWGRGRLLLPQSAGTDGMYLLLLRKPAG